MKNNPSVDFSNDIIKAAVANLSYDPQSEGSRAIYIFELIELSNQKQKIKKAILNALATEKTNPWGLDQLFDLAALFAKQGDKEARKAIYKRFYAETIQGYECLGQEAIIEIDGLEGLKYIAKTKGREIQKNPEEWDGSWLVDGFQEENPAINVYQELEMAGEADPYIKTYLDTIKHYKAKFEKRERQKYNYEIVSEKINSNAIVPLPPAMARDLSASDIQKLADDFLREKDRNKLEKYMRVFDRVVYPYDYRPILQLAKSRRKKTDRLVEYAAGALKHFSGADIRDFAIEKLKKVRIPDDYLDLLVSNYKQGDAQLITEIVSRCKNEEEIHSLVWGIIRIYRANKTKECREPLEAVYSKLTCGIHRKEIIELLLENGVLSDKIKSEIIYDSDDATRGLLKNST